jgi:DNA-binding NarL/FixJ family response regulator
VTSNLEISEGPTSILVLEDLPETSDYLVDIINETFSNVVVETAGTLAAALDAVSMQSFDIILVDLGLPDGSGIDLIKKVRSENESSYIIVTTIFEDERHMTAALRAGSNGYLLKDEPRESLMVHLREISNNRPPVSNRVLGKIIDRFNRQDADLVALTAREQDVLTLIAKGYNVTESAELLGLTPNTVKGYVKTIYAKLGISSRAEATTEAIKRHLIDI